MKLRTILQKLPLEQLLQIAEFWQFQIPESVQPLGEGGQARLVEYLYPRMQTAKYFFRTMERLAPRQRNALKFLAVHGGELPAREVIERCFGGDIAGGENDLRELAAKGFIYLDVSEPAHPYVVLPESVRYIFELGTQLTGYLGALLQRMAFNDLAALAEKVTGDKSFWNIQREKVIRRLREYLLNPENLRRHIESLPVDERLLFHALVERDGYGFYGDLLEVGGRRRFDLSRTQQLNSLLTRRGIVFQVSDGANKYANLLMVPRDVLYIVTHDYAPDVRPLEELERIGGGKDEFRPAMVVDNSLVVFRDLVILGSSIHAQNFKVLATGGLSRAELRRLVPLLGPSRSLKYATFLAAFLIWAKYLRPVGEYWRLSDSFSDTLANPGRLFAELFHWWLDVNHWNEAHPDGLLWEEEEPTRGFVALIEMRREVVQAIFAANTAGAWIPYASFEEIVLPKMVAVASPDGKADASMRGQLRRILYSIVTEPLTWLGLLSLGAAAKTVFSPDSPIDIDALSQKKNLKKTGVPALKFSFRPTDLARGMFETGAIQPCEVFRDVAPNTFPLSFSAEWLIVQPNCEIVAPPDLRLSNLLSLCGFCEVRSIDVMTSLAVTRESLQRALDLGVRGQDVRDLLTRLSRSGLPETVDQLITDCLERHGEAFLGSAGGYVVTEDEGVIEQIRSNKEFEDIIKDVVGKSTLILAPGANLERFARQLRGLGLMPRVETGTVETTRDQRFHLNLSAEEYYELLALLRLVEIIEEELDAEIVDDRGRSLIDHIEPDSAGFALIHEEAQKVALRYSRKVRSALLRMRSEIEEKYKTQVSRIVAKARGQRGATRFQFRGANPAVERNDIVQLLKFALEHELETEIHYVKRNEAETTLRIYPKSFEGNRLYAYCVESDREAIYSVDRILKAALI
ncbi:MAG: helicase-associated domain-containing protein [Candidatus Sumerlaeaceae bacterium]